MEYKINTKEHNILFTSDTHFNHANIMKYCNRPYGSVEEMNEALIENWNAKVGPNDEVFHLGDFAFGNINEATNIVKRLNGRIHLITGNHDYGMLAKSTEFANCFEDVNAQARVIINDRKVWMNHYPFLTFEGVWQGLDAAYQIFGHVHSGKNNKTGLDNDRLRNLMPSQYDVGVDNNDYAPISWHELESIIHEQQMSLNMYR